MSDAALQLELDIQRAAASPELDDATIEMALRAALAGRRKQVEICVRITGEQESRTLNRRYRAQDKATNVLSFPVESGLPELPLLGDLVLCAALVRKEATAQGKPVGEHAAHLLVHGVLHLLGYDHVEEHDAMIMENEEKAILAGLGIPDPYLQRETTEDVS